MGYTMNDVLDESDEALVAMATKAQRDELLMLLHRLPESLIQADKQWWDLHDSVMARVLRWDESIRVAEVAIAKRCIDR